MRVSIVRFARSATGCRNATAVEQRMPLRWVTWYRPTPSCAAALKSSFASSPTCSAASTQASAIGLFERLSLTVSGPPTPWYSFSPRSLSSLFLK